MTSLAKSTIENTETTKSEVTFNINNNQQIIIQYLHTILNELYSLLFNIDKEQSISQWPVLIEIPIFIDKIQASHHDVNDEYVYWCN